MRSRASLIAGPPEGVGDYRIEERVDVPPVAWRSTPEAVYMVGTAASPTGDDQLEVAVRVRSGALLAVRSAAAMVAWSGLGTVQSVEVAVEDGGALDWALEPLVTTSGCNHTQRSTVHLHGGASLRWREVLVLGRHREGTGRLRTLLSVTTDSAPLLHHELVVGEGAPGWDGPAVLGSTRAVGLLLLAGTEWPPAAAARGPGWAVMPLEGPGVLALAAAATASEVAAALADAERLMAGSTERALC